MGKEEESLKNYILGRLPEPEQIKIEQRLLLDSDYVELLQIVEEELIDAYARGSMSEPERKEFEGSLSRSRALHDKLIVARSFVTRADEWEPAFKPRRSSESVRERGLGSWRLMVGRMLTPAWRLAVSAFLVLAGGLAAWQIFFYQSLADQARIALKRSFHESPIEGRIAGINWPPHRGTLSGAPEAADGTSLRGAELFSQQAVAAKGNADSHHALGQVYLAIGDFGNAIRELEKALERNPNNAEINSDLGTAYLERGHAAQEKTRQDKSAPETDTSVVDFSQCLNHLNLALEQDPGLPPALFNRALCHEYMVLLPQARTDWQDYLNHDNKSAWADEARRHLKSVDNELQKNSKTDAEANAEGISEFVSAYLAGNRDSATKVICRNREWITGQIIWWQILGDFLELTAQGQLAEAHEALERLRYVGELEQALGGEPGQHSGDPFVSELADFYSLVSSHRCIALSEAYKRISDGNALNRAGRCGDALGRYGEAREILYREGDRWQALVADYLIGSCRIQTGEADESLPPFQQLISTCQAKGYFFLLAQSLYSLGMVQDRRERHSDALESTKRALQISERIGDIFNTQRSLSQIADQYRKLGNYESATTYVTRCLEQARVEWPRSRQMCRNCRQLVQLLAARRLNDAAGDYAEEALRLALEIHDPSFAAVSYEDFAILSWKRDHAKALELAQAGFAAAVNQPGQFAYACVQLGNLYKQAGDPSQAMRYYQQCIEYINAQENTRAYKSTQPSLPGADRLPAMLYDAHKGKLFCLLKVGDDNAVEEQLKTTLDLLDTYRQGILEEQNRNTFFNLEQTVYDAAVDFEFSRRGREEDAFEYSEESRARSLLDLIDNTSDSARSLREVRQELPDQTQLIEYVALEDKLLICLVSKSEFKIRQSPIGLDKLTDKVLRFRSSILAAPGPVPEAEELAQIQSQARELYQLLIEPIALSPENGRKICFVPDKILNSLPFAALASPHSGSYLIEDYDVTLAPSATVYLICSSRGGHTTDMGHEHLLGVGNPSFDRLGSSGLSSIQSTEAQVKEIAKLYPSGSPLVLTGPDARKSLVREEMANADVIHLATHYKVYPGRPMNSRLLLTQARDSNNLDDSAGFLQADEVYALKLQQRAPVVVLSACDSGVEYYYNGEGMIGMSRVFIAAGAPVVVASLWQVATNATGELMVRFHQHRKRDQKPTAEALALAQRDMLTGAFGDDYRHPYYWAGFAAIGGETTF